MRLLAALRDMSALLDVPEWQVRGRDLQITVARCKICDVSYGSKNGNSWKNVAVMEVDNRSTVGCPPDAKVAQ